MPSNKSAVATLVAVAAATGWMMVAAGQAPQSGAMPLEPTRERGSSITPAYEGWFPNEDGSFTMLIGYFNRNAKQALDIPVGPNNRIEPGGPDMGQPTYFETRRQWGVFTIKVPKDFGTKKLTWTLTANGETNAIPFTLHKAYEVEPYKESGMGNTPPTVAFVKGGPTVTGPPIGIAATLTGSVNVPVPIAFWGADQRGPLEDAPARGRGAGAPPFTASLHKFRGPGDVTFTPERPQANRETGEVTATASFSAPGDYILRVQLNDASGEGGQGFQCCWTNAHVRVTVK
jgi:hypothetical protein